MEEFVSRNKIAANIEAADYEDAIRKAGKLLVESGDIKEGYIEAMIASVKELGPYMVIAKGFALAHAAPSEDVLNDSLSLINLKEGVNFGSHNDPVKVVMCLACKDKESHMEGISKVAMRLMKSGMIEALEECDSSEALYETINGTD